MRNLMSLGAALSAGLILGGCTSEQTYGINSSRWAAMSQEQRSEIQTAYVNTQESLLEEQGQQKVSDHADKIRVAVYGGRALMPPFDYYQPYEKEVVDLEEGSCQTCTLFRPDGEKEVDLKLCYRNHNLEVDPSKFVFDKRHGTVAFHYSPLWDRGFTYTHVKTSGYARLKNAHIFVKHIT